MPNAYAYSAPLGARLSTSTAARTQRALRALSRIGISRRESDVEIEETDQASASVATVRAYGVRVLVSYETAVAYQNGHGHVATLHGAFSRTTDRSVANFAPRSVERLELEEFNERLRRALT